MGFCHTTGEWSTRCAWADIHDDRTRPDIVERQLLRQELFLQITRLPRWEGAGWAGGGGRSYWLAKGPIEAVYDIARGIYSVAPFLWWPQDRAWCVFRDIDFDFSLIATTDVGSEQILSLAGVKSYDAGL